MRRTRRTAVLRLVPVLALSLAATACAELTLAWAPARPVGEAAAPPLAVPPATDEAALPSAHSPSSHGPASHAAGASAPPSSREWRSVRESWREHLSDNVYGRLPGESRIEIVGRRMVDAAAFGGRGRYEEIDVRPLAVFGGVEARAPADVFTVALITPTAPTGPAPLIMMETFCSRWTAAPHPAASRPPGEEGDDGMGGFFGAVATYVFGRHICTPPFEAILDRGYAVAVFAPGEIIPDSAGRGLEALAALAAGHGDPSTRWGAIAGWGWAFSRVVDALADDPRLDPSAFIAWGHSRYAKAALVAAAFDPRVAAVIAHQSGTGGASLNWRKAGESVGSIVETYPHWFGPRYATLADASKGEGTRPDFDQHMLLALIAPRPMLLGNARRDVWSDPGGAFRAAEGADPAWEAAGARGLTVARLDRFDPTAEVAFWMRPGTHGVVKEDWTAFLAFLEAHFPVQPPALDGAGE